jgi:hypothetical protein
MERRDLDAIRTDGAPLLRGPDRGANTDTPLPSKSLPGAARSRIHARSGPARSLRRGAFVLGVFGAVAIGAARPAWAQCEFSEDQKVVAADRAAGDIYGGAVGVSGEWVFVMSEWDDDNGVDSGSAYIYRQNGSTWDFQAKVKPPDGAAGDNFGRSVAVDGTTAVIGAHWDDTTGGMNAGSAYVWRFNGSTWNAVKKLVPFDTKANQAFGNACAIDGDVLAVTSWRDNVVGSESGSTYVWRFNGVEWVFEQKLLPSDPASNDQFGRGVWISGDDMVIGAWKDDDGGSNTGSAYVFHYNGSSWVQVQKLHANDAAAEDNFGFSVSMDGNLILVGSHRADTDGLTNTGAAYFFRYNGSSWVQEQKVTASDKQANDWMGWAVAVDGDTALISSHHAYATPLVSPGYGYIFQHVGGTWVEQQKLVSSDGVPGDTLAFHLALDGDIAVMGAWRDDAEAGSAYIYDIARTDFNGDDIPDACQPFRADVASVSLVAGDPQTFTLDAGPAKAGASYWIFGSFSGTSPGIDFGGGVVLPLNFDTYFNLTLTKPHAIAFVNYVGLLSGSGTATASFDLPAGLDPSLAGFTLYHAYVAAEVYGVVDYASNAMPVLLMP